MAADRVVPGPLGSEVGEDLGGAGAAQPVVGVRSHHSVRDVLVRATGRLRRAVHGRHRTATGVTAALALLGSALLGPALAQPAAGSDSGSDEKVTFTVGLMNEVDSFNPFNGIE